MHLLKKITALLVIQLICVAMAPSASDAQGLPSVSQVLPMSEVSRIVGRKDIKSLKEEMFMEGINHQFSAPGKAPVRLIITKIASTYQNYMEGHTNVKPLSDIGDKGFISVYKDEAADGLPQKSGIIVAFVRGEYLFELKCIEVGTLHKGHLVNAEQLTQLARVADKNWSKVGPKEGKSK